MKSILLRVLIWIIIFSSTIFPQTTEHGTILKIDFDDEIVDTQNTVCSWMNKYHTVFTQNGDNYLLGKYYYEANPIGPEGELTFMYNTHSNQFYNLLDCSMCDIRIYNWPKKPNPFQVEKGTWVFDVDGNCFIDIENNIFRNIVDSLNKSLVYICGKVYEQHLSVLLNNESYELEYYLVNLLNSPNIAYDYANKIKLEGFESQEHPLKIQQLSDDLYLLQTVYSNAIELVRKNDSLLTFIKPMVNSYDSNWFLENDTIYIKESVENGEFGISKYNIDFSDTTFYKIKTVLSCAEEKFSIDFNFKNLAYILSDTLYLFDIRNEKIKKQWFVGDLNLPSNPIISDNGIYIHQLDKTVDVNENEPADNFPKEFNLDQNYPNPFNPVTTINYTISVGNANFASPTTLIVYDVLGNEIKTLVNEQQLPGKYSVKFDGSNLASGVYFCRLQVGEFFATKKLMLIK